MASKKKEAPDPAPETRKPRELLTVAEELPALAAEVTQVLEENWKASVNGNVTPGRLHEACFRYGQRLGELNRAPERFIEGLENQIDGLVEGTLQTSSSELDQLENRIQDLQDTKLPNLRKEQSRLEAEVTSLQERGGHPFHWYRLVFYLFPALALAVAEYALGEEVTKRALGLSGPLWRLFPLALIALPLVFKQFLDSEGKPLPGYYLHTLLVLIVIVMFPLAYLRAEQLSETVTKKRGGSGIVNPFGDPPRVSSGPAASIPSGSGRPGSPAPPAAKRGRSIGLLTLTFVCFGLIFPMLSGLAFAKGFHMADVGWNNRKARKKIPPAQKHLEETRRALQAGRDEVESSRARTVKLKKTLSDIDLADKLLYELQSYLRGLDVEGAEDLAGRFEEVRGKGLQGLSSKLREELPRLREASAVNLAFAVGLYSDKVEAAARGREVTPLEKLAKTKKKTVRSFVEDGYEAGRATAFALLRSYEPEEMLRMVDDRKFHEALFRSGLRKGEEN